MKKIYLIANWKMQLNQSDSVRLTVEIAKSYKNINNNLEIVLAPSFTAISNVRRKLKNSNIKLASQNIFYHEKGAYTGEISPTNLKELGVEYVIIGHSERREYLNETDDDVNRKVKIALKNNLTPIICVGETMQERQDNKTDLVLIRQVTKALEDVEINKKLIIAYEPVWVIGSGQAVDPKEAEHAAQVIKYNLPANNNIDIIYGGSIDADNISNFLNINLISGFLVGGASLDSNKFLKLVAAVCNDA